MKIYLFIIILKKTKTPKKPNKPRVFSLKKMKNPVEKSKCKNPINPDIQ